MPVCFQAVEITQKRGNDGGGMKPPLLGKAVDQWEMVEVNFSSHQMRHTRSFEPGIEDFCETDLVDAVLGVAPSPEGSFTNEKRVLFREVVNLAHSREDFGKGSSFAHHMNGKGSCRQCPESVCGEELGLKLCKNSEPLLRFNIAWKSNAKNLERLSGSVDAGDDVNANFMNHEHLRFG